MASFKIVSWGSYTFGTTLRGYIKPDSDPYGIDSQLIDRGHHYPDFGDWAAQGRKLNATILRPRGSSLTTAGQVAQLINRLFYPRLGEQPLIVVHPVTGLNVGITARVLSVQPNSSHPNWVYDIQLQTADGDWKAVTTTGPATAPTLTVVGDAPVNAKVSVTPSVSGPYVYRQRVTIQDVTGRGLTNYPIIASFATDGLALTGPSDFTVIYDTRKIPFAVTGVGTTTTHVAFRVDVLAGQSAYVDIYYSAYIANLDTPNTLDMGQMDVAASSNATWHYTSVWPIWAAPAAAGGVWRPIKLGTTLEGVQNNAGNELSFGVSAEGGNGMSISYVQQTNAYPNDANGITAMIGSGADTITILRSLGNPVSVNSSLDLNIDGYHIGDSGSSGTLTLQGPAASVDLSQSADATAVLNAFATMYNIPTSWLTVGMTGTVPAARTFHVTFVGDWAGHAVTPPTIAANTLTSSPSGTAIAASLTNIVNGSGGNVANSLKCSLLYRVANSSVWTVAWSTSTAGTYTAPVSIPNATQVAIIVEPLHTEAAGTVIIGSNATTIDLNAGLRPTVSIAARANAFVMYGSITNSTTGSHIDFTEVYMDADTLVIDADAGRVYTVGNTDWYGFGPLPSDPSSWFELVRGANTVVENFYVPAASGVGTTPMVVAVNYVWVERYPIA